MLLTPDLIKLRLKKLGIRSDKYLGQHFLVDSGVLESIIETAKTFITPDDTILEVGSGLGVLTEALVKLPNKIVAIERDPILARNLAAFLSTPSNLEVIEGDVLKALSIPSSLQFTASWCVVANISYAITSPLLRKLVGQSNPPHHILVLVQKESAERIAAKPGDSARGLLTVEIEIGYEARTVTTIPSTAFWPTPKVESALLLLTQRPEPLISKQETAALLRVAAAGFSAKRKQLHNSLVGSLNLPSDTIRAALGASTIEPSRRAETLSLSEWERLTTQLKNSV